MSRSLPGGASSPDGRSVPTRYLFFGLASLGLILVSMDMTMIAVAIPLLTNVLDTSLIWVGWVLTSYQLVQMVIMPVAGRLSDRFGPKRVFMLCIGTYALGSVLSGLAPNIAFLILFRAIQALGAGGLMPAAVGIISDQFKERRIQAIGLYTSIFPIGGILGPIAGGWILQYLSWRWLFFVTPPVSLLILLGAQWLLREEPRPRQRQGIDALGLGLFAASMVAIMYAMTWVGNDLTIWHSPLFWALLAGGALLFYLFIGQERRAEQPVLDLELVTHRPFWQANLYNMAFGASAFGFFSFLPYFAVVQYQMGPAQSGMVLMPRALVMIPTAVVTSVFIGRLGYRIPLVGGMLLISTTALLLSFGWSQVLIGPLELDGFWLMALVVAISGVGMGLVAPTSKVVSIDAMPSKSAAITGLLGMFRISGGIMGISSVTLALSLFPDQALGARTVFFAIGLLLLATIPLALMIPDTARQRWRQQAAAARGAVLPLPLLGIDVGRAVGGLDPGGAGQDEPSADKGSTPQASRLGGG